jgi:class 3 adenylate cyclase
MAETRKLAAILAADVVGYSKLAGSDEDRTLARLRALRSNLIDPTIAVHHGRVVKRTGDGDIQIFLCLPWTNARTASDLRQIAALERYVMSSICLTIETKVDPNQRA